MKFTLLHPSRGRPDLALYAYNEWVTNWSKKHEVEYILSLDKSDPSLSEYKTKFKGLADIVVSDSTNCVQATNAGAKSASGDIIIYLSDDFACPHHWDIHLASKVPGFPNYLLWVNDGIQKKNAVLTIPMMSMGLYKHFGHFWHPSYKSMWCDVDLFFVCERMKALVDCHDLLFEHRHHSVSKSVCDATSRAHDNGDRNKEGREIFEDRKRGNFAR